MGYYYFFLKKDRIRLMILNPVNTPLKMTIPELKLFISVLALFSVSVGWNICRALSTMRFLDARISSSFSAFCCDIISSVITFFGFS